MELLGEILFLFPVVMIVTLVICDRWPRIRNKVSLILNTIGAYALICAAILGADVAADIILWDDAEFSIFNWSILGFFFQAVGFHTARRKWPLLAPNLLAIAAVGIESLVHPSHRPAIAAFVLWTFLFTVFKKETF